VEGNLNFIEGEVMSVFVFPGQGSQYVGMFSEFLDKEEFKDYFERVKEVVGEDFIKKVQEGPEDVLRDTRISQPGIFIVSVILSDYLMENGVIPKYLVGHSLGEYSAFYAGKVFNFETGLKLIKKRAEVMNSVAERVDGGMWAVIGDLSEIEESLMELQKEEIPLWAANYNAPSQLVLSGKKEAFEIWYSKMKNKVKKVVPLSVSGPFHSPLMREAEEIFKSYLENIEFSDPKTYIVSSTTGDVVKSKEEAKEILVKQFTSSVRWIDAINKLTDLGERIFIEVGPGKVLQGLIKKIDFNVKVLGVEKVEDLEKIRGEL